MADLPQKRRRCRQMVHEVFLKLNPIWKIQPTMVKMFLFHQPWLAKQLIVVAPKCFLIMIPLFAKAEQMLREPLRNLTKKENGKYDLYNNLQFNNSSTEP